MSVTLKNALVASVRTTQKRHHFAQLEIAGEVEPGAMLEAYKANREGRRTGLYRDTATRQQWRGLMDACVGLPEVILAVSFLKDCGEARTMLCQPYERDTDCTHRYATVWDVQAADYRRINLDAIVKVTVETHSVASQYPDKYTA